MVDPIVSTVLNLVATNNYFEGTAVLNLVLLVTTKFSSSDLVILNQTIYHASTPPPTLKVGLPIFFPRRTHLHPLPAHLNCAAQAPKLPGKIGNSRTGGCRLWLCRTDAHTGKTYQPLRLPHQLCSCSSSTRAVFAGIMAVLLP